MSYAVSDEARENATRMIEKVPGVARMAMATGSPEYMSAFRSWLKGLGAPVYTAEEAQAVRASMSLTSANGGYALPFLLDPTLIHTVRRRRTRSGRSPGRVRHPGRVARRDRVQRDHRVDR